MMKARTFLPVLIVVALAACSKKTETTEPVVVVAPVPAPAVVIPAPAPAPAAAAVPAAPTASGGDLALGEKIYTSTCLSCHGTGVLGAPKFADKAAWEPRLAKGKDVLYTSALNGFKTMPPKGGNATLKDEEVKAAVDYMANKAM